MEDKRTTLQLAPAERKLERPDGEAALGRRQLPQENTIFGRNHRSSVNLPPRVKSHKGRHVCASCDCAATPEVHCTGT